MLSESQIESLSDLLASMLVAEWHAQHQMVQSADGQRPPDEDSTNTYDKSNTYGPDPDDHAPGPTPTLKDHGALKLVPGRRKSM